MSLVFTALAGFFLAIPAQVYASWHIVTGFQNGDPYMRRWVKNIQTPYEWRDEDPWAPFILFSCELQWTGVLIARKWACHSEFLQPQGNDSQKEEGKFGDFCIFLPFHLASSLPNLKLLDRWRETAEGTGLANQGPMPFLRARKTLW